MRRYTWQYPALDNLLHATSPVRLRFYIARITSEFRELALYEDVHETHDGFRCNQSFQECSSCFLSYIVDCMMQQSITQGMVESP